MMAYNPHRKRRDRASSLLTVVFRNPLINFLALDNDLLACMVKLGLISMDQNQVLLRNLTQNGIKNSIDLLLTMIKRIHRQDGEFLLFMKALRESGDTTNALLADFIEGVNRPEAFDIEHRLINEFYPELQVIDPTNIAPYLTYISVDEKLSLMRKCEMGETNLARTTLLLLTIRTLKPDWFEVFLDALEKNNHRNIAKELRSSRQRALASRNREKENNFSKSLESLTLDSALMEDDTTHQDILSMEESEGSLQYGLLHGTDSFDSPDSSRPRTQRRSRSPSMKRSHCSPQRKRTGKKVPFKKKRSQSKEQLHKEGVVHSSSVTNYNITVVGNGNHTTILEDGNGHVSKVAVMAQPDERHVGEDQLDHAAMPLEDVHVQADYMTTGDGISPQRDKTTSAEQRPVLRNYQLELAEDAVKGKNTVLVAPTGSGKTHVAAYIIHDHFIRLQSTPIQERCALFLVNTVNLVAQQEDKLKKLLLPKNFFSITGLFGASELSLRDVITSKNVIVLTAQILENALNDDSSNITLDRFPLLVFDECHLTQKNHAYNAIMAHYLDGKQSGKANLPQIIGMTASLGTGKAKNQEQANQHTIQICANMDAQSISMVTRHTEELKNRVNIPIEVPPIEVNCRQVDPFADKIKEVMKKVEKLLLESPTDAIHEQMRNEKIPTEKGSQAYRQWCDRIRKNAQKIITQDTDDYRILVICSKHLMGYNSALLINKQVRSKDAYKYLKQMIDKEKDRMACFEDTGHKLLKIFLDEQSNLETIKDDPNNENPLLKKLCEIILEEYRIRPRSRAILFVKTIDSTQALQDWIQDTPELAFLNPGRIAGSRDMNSKEQNKVIKDFYNGDHHMLVATNLLEQGTDVPACNLVIRLDYVPSDSGHVQIKGRTRAEGGRSYLISLIGSNAAARNEVNRQRESMMKKAALNLNAKSETEFLKLVESQQERDKGDREAQKMQKREIMQDNKGKIFSFHCVDCGKYVLKSNQIGVYTDMYVVLDSVISGKMKKKAHPKPKKLDQDKTIIAKIFCYRCEQVFGSLTQVKNVYYPCIKITRFSLVNENSNDKTGKTYASWTAANLDITELKHLPKEAAVKVSNDLLREIKKIDCLL